MRRAIFAAVAGALLGSATAQANFFAIYTSSTANVYNYTLRFTVDQPGETLRSGDTVTMYDVAIAPDIANVVAVTSPAGQIAVSRQLTGITPADLVGTAGIADSPTLQNITFMYTGPDRTAPQDFTGAVITMVPLYSNVRVGKESGSTEINLNLSSDSTFHQDSSDRSVLLPVILCTCGIPTPEPGSLAVMGLGMAAMLVRRRMAGSITRTSLM